jgi:hypothetical protein
VYRMGDARVARASQSRQIPPREPADLSISRAVRPRTPFAFAPSPSHPFALAPLRPRTPSPSPRPCRGPGWLGRGSPGLKCPLCIQERPFRIEIEFEFELDFTSARLHLGKLPRCFVGAENHSCPHARQGGRFGFSGREPALRVKIRSETSSVNGIGSNSLTIHHIFSCRPRPDRGLPTMNASRCRKDTV